MYERIGDHFELLAPGISSSMWRLSYRHNWYGTWIIGGYYFTRQEALDSMPIWQEVLDEYQLKIARLCDPIQTLWGTF